MKRSKPVEDAVTAFLANRKSEGLQETSIRKYDNTLDKLKEFCEAIEVDSLSEIDTERLDRFRAGRGLAQITASKELELPRVFFGFRENPAKKIKSPRNIKGMMWCRSPRAKSRRFYRPAKGLEGNRMSGCEHARWFSRFVILRSE
jgi:site-specific recombinase XerC